MFGCQLLHLFVHFFATKSERLLIVTITGRVHKPVFASFDINPSYVRIRSIKFLGPFPSCSIGKVFDFVLGAHKDGDFGFDLSRIDGLERRQTIKEEGEINFVGVLKQFEADGCSQRKSYENYFVAPTCYKIYHRENNHSYFFLIERPEICAAIVLAFFLCLSEKVRINNGELVVDEGLSHDPHIVLQSQVLVEHDHIHPRVILIVDIAEHVAYQVLQA